VKSPEGRTLAAALKSLVDIAFFLAVAAAALIGLGAIVFTIAAVSGGTFDFGIGGVSVAGDNWQAVAPAFLSGLIYATGGIVILTCLRRMFVTLAAGDPFVPANAKRLELIGWAIAVLEVSRYAVQAASAWIIVTFGHPSGGVLDVGFRPSFPTWIAVVVVFVLAQVFREGARLREDRDLTI
jgi:hypothetical protein